MLAGGDHQIGLDTGLSAEPKIELWEGDVSLLPTKVTGKLVPLADLEDYDRAVAHVSQQLQFAASNLLISFFSFNLGIEIGQLLGLCAFVPALAMLFRGARWAG